METNKGKAYKLKMWIVENKRYGIDFSAKCKQSDLMELFFNAYPNEKRCRNLNTFKIRYRVYSLTDKELEDGIQYEAIIN